MQHAPFQSFSIPITNEADGKQGVIVFAGDSVGSALLGNTYLARSPGSEVREGSQLRNPWQKCLCQSYVALLSPAAAENTGGVCLQESSVVREGCTALPLGHGKTSGDGVVSSTFPGLPTSAGAALQKMLALCLHKMGATAACLEIWEMVLRSLFSCQEGG